MCKYILVEWTEAVRRTRVCSSYASCSTSREEDQRQMRSNICVRHSRCLGLWGAQPLCPILNPREWFVSLFYHLISWADPRGGARVQICSFSCRFWETLAKIIGWRLHISGWRPLLWEILDPPLDMWPIVFKIYWWYFVLSATLHHPLTHLYILPHLQEKLLFFFLENVKSKA